MVAIKTLVTILNFTAATQPSNNIEPVGDKPAYCRQIDYIDGAHGMRVIQKREKDICVTYHIFADPNEGEIAVYRPSENKMFGLFKLFQKNATGFTGIEFDAELYSNDQGLNGYSMKSKGIRPTIPDADDNKFIQEFPSYLKKNDAKGKPSF